MKYYLYLLPVLILVSCGVSDSQLEYALNFAGKNRGELEKVLNYYQDQPEKLQAARFLIKNMPRWYSYEGWELDSIQVDLSQKEIPQEVAKKWEKTNFFSLTKVYDSHVITANYLIENIEMAFEVRECPWNKTLPFKDFCELILPYRIGDEPLSSWRKLYHDYYMAILDSTYHGSDIIEACKVVDNDLKRVNYKYRTDFHLPHMNAVFLFHHRIGWCREACDLIMYAMRSCGIPCATEFLEYSPDYQYYHVWTTLRDTTGRFIQFGFNEFEATREEVKSDGRKKGKVYRYCFGQQEEKIAGITKNKKIPDLLRNRFIKDVTSNYFGQNAAVVPLQINNEEFIYLGVFSPDGWIPIDISKRKGNNVVFKNIEPNIIYLPLHSDGKNHCPAGYPFIYAEGKVHVLTPDTTQIETAVLKRKMSIKPTISEWLYRGVVGAKIQAGNTPWFNSPELLYEFKDTLNTNYSELEPYKQSKYRYIRLVASPGARLEAAELACYEDELCKKQIEMHRINEVEPLERVDNLTDGNVLTYFQARDTSVSIVYDLKKEYFIRKIVFSPRNDDNFIWPGDQYELFYQDGINGWKSLGVQTAIDRKLKFDVPSNALLWLRDLTKGREEQIFIYKNEKQLFTIDLK